LGLRNLQGGIVMTVYVMTLKFESELDRVVLNDMLKNLEEEGFIAEPFNVQLTEEDD
jgi:hypothetical protein